MTRPRISLLLTLLLTALLVSACSSSAMTASSWPGLTVTDQTAYLAAGSAVYAVDTTHGTIRWQYPEKPGRSTPSFYAAPAPTDDGQVLLSGYDNTLYSLDAATGAQNWSFAGASNRYVGAPLVTENAIYAPNTDGRLYALDHNGHPLWSEPFQSANPLWAAPAYRDGVLYLAAMDHTLYALNAQNGQVRWRTALGGAMVDTPTLSADGTTLYVGTFANEVVAVATQDGQVQWRTRTDGWVWASPVLRDEVLYVGDLSGKFYALDTTQGAIIWTIQPDGPITGAPLVTDQGLYLATEAGTLYAVDFNGTIRWQQTLDGKLHTAPVQTADGLILVAPLGSEALLYAFQADGSQVWQLQPPGK